MDLQPSWVRLAAKRAEDVESRYRSLREEFERIERPVATESDEE